jgi:DNA-binding NarL/FixJ family response regulator
MSKIAWIEDDHDEIPSLVRLLELDEHNICGCDAVILDIILPPATDDLYQGVSVLRKLREECKYSGPVVICSVVRNPDVLKAVRELGVSDILHKPVRPSKLYDAVKKVLAEGGPEISQ